VKKCLTLFVFVLLLTALPGGMLAQNASTIVSNAAKAMGADTLKTIQYSGAGSNAGIGQNLNPTAAWPLVRVKTYDRQIDFDAPLSRVRMVRIQNDMDQPPQTQDVLPNAAFATQYDIWLTPQGFLKAAMANPSTASSRTIGGKKYNVVSVTLQNKYKLNGYINDQNIVERVETWIDNPVLGDMLVESDFSDYKDFGGIKFPGMIIQKQGGSPVLILVVSDVKPNAAINLQPPQTAPAAPQAVSVQSQKITDGVYYLTGGTHHSVAVEFSDHSVVIEAPQNEARSLAVIAEVKKLIPNKPIRYLINTHHHFDHSGGLRTYVDEGATIITHQINQPFYEKTFAAPHTLNPDKLAASKKKATIETVNNRMILSDSKVVNDSTRTVELHLIKGSPHNEGILMAYLPKEKLLVEVDVYNPPNQPAAAPAAPVGGQRGAAPGGQRGGNGAAPPAGPQRGGPPATGAPPAAGGQRGAAGGRGGGPGAAPAAPAAPVAPANPATTNLVDNLERLELEYEQILPLHGPGVVTKADLYRAAGKPLPGQAPGRGRGAN
jgi:hypothetical protein